MHNVRSSIKKAWLLATPYWRGPEKTRAFVLLITVVALNLVLVGTTVLFTYWQRAFYNALADKDWHGFLGSLLWWQRTAQGSFTLGFAPVLVVFFLATAYELYLRQALQIRWRHWMTEHFVDSWLQQHAYLHLSHIEQSTDNPDQRISEDIKLFVDSAITLGTGGIRSLASLFSFVFLLWSMSDPIRFGHFTIHGYLVWTAAGYALFGTWLAHVTGRRLIPLHFEQQKLEADFRFGLVQVREHAEGIAFSRGEEEQQRELFAQFRGIVTNWRAMMIVTKRLTLLTSAYSQAVLVFPLAVTAPSYFAGRMPLGGMFQASNAFVQVQTALSWVVQSYPDLTTWLATVDRLAEFRRALLQTQHLDNRPSHQIGTGNSLLLRKLQIALPSGKYLLCDVELEVAPGERLLLRGASGSGKSTLLRVIAGIWPFGSGEVDVPSQKMMFVSQKPYLPSGTLKRTACYPISEEAISDAEVTNALQKLGLDHLEPELTCSDLWAQRLSGGEQQRLALVRALLNRPQWLFLDEATAALDPVNTLHAYEVLLQELPGLTLISIAHDDALERFHNRVLRVENGILRKES